MMSIFEKNKFSAQESLGQKDARSNDTNRTEKGIFLHEVNKKVRILIKALLVGAALGGVPEAVNLAHFLKDKAEWKSEGEAMASKLKEIEQTFGEMCAAEIEGKHNGAKPEFEFIPTKHAGANSEKDMVMKNEEIPLNDTFYIKRGVFQEITNKTFPKGWTTGNKQLSWKSEDKGGMSSAYGLGGKAAGKAFRINGNIELYGNLEGDFLNVLSHEIAHFNDWKSENLNASDSAELLLQIGKRLQSEDRYRSSYVESISNPNKMTENIIKATEYWAEICQQFFADPSQLPAEDLSLVWSIVRKTDPEFDVGKANEKRNELMMDGLIRSQEKINGNN